MRQVSLIMFPAAALLAALAPVLIVPLLGEKWTPYRSSFPVLSLLAVYAGNRTVVSIFFEGYKSIGKPWIVSAYHAVKLAIMVPSIIYGAQHGILGLALAYIPLQLIEIPAAVLLARRVLAVSPLLVWRAVQTPILATLFMTGIVIAAESWLLRAAHAGDLLTLATCLPAAGLIYLGALLLIDRHILVEARSVLLKGF
jgi:O-antigen/teichoic acid export membrane protein